MTKQSFKMTVTYLGQTSNGGFKVKSKEYREDELSLSRLKDLKSMFDIHEILEIKIRREHVFDI